MAYVSMLLRITWWHAGIHPTLFPCMFLVFIWSLGYRALARMAGWGSLWEDPGLMRSAWLGEVPSGRILVWWGLHGWVRFTLWGSWFDEVCMAVRVHSGRGLVWLSLTDLVHWYTRSVTRGWEQWLNTYSLGFRCLMSMYVTNTFWTGIWNTSAWRL